MIDIDVKNMIDIFINQIIKYIFSIFSFVLQKLI